MVCFKQIQMHLIGELLDIAQIEVLKGPQGALYGRNATSGAILITTKAPSEESESTAVVGLGCK